VRASSEDLAIITSRYIEMMAGFRRFCIQCQNMLPLRARTFAPITPPAANPLILAP
jgi:hypothetical protein